LRTSKPNVEPAYSPRDASDWSEAPVVMSWSQRSTLSLQKYRWYKDRDHVYLPWFSHVTLYLYGSTDIHNSLIH
jgi:hypothetical protein